MVDYIWRMQISRVCKMSLVVLCKCDEIWKPGSIPKEELGKKIKLIFNSTERP